MARVQPGCPCEACKGERRDAYNRATVARLMVEARGRRDAKLTQIMTRMSDATWTSQDGRITPVRHMDSAHLFFAIAKGMREGWNNTQALKVEAARRLLVDLLA